MPSIRPLLLGLLVAAAPAAAGDPAPPWFRAHIAALTAAGGLWITDNSAYRSGTETVEQYAIRWEWGLNRQSMTGRLFGLAGGREVGTYWQFRVYWHPGRNEAMMVQHGGDGRLGEGPVQYLGPGRTEAVQEFWTPAGVPTRVRHLEHLIADTNLTESFDWVDGAWAPRRTYRWIRRRGSG